MKNLSSRRKKWIERTAKNDRSYKRILHSRIFAVAVSSILQLAVYALIIWSVAYNSAIGFAVQLTAWLLSLIFTVYLVNRTDNASVRTSWIIVILIAPVFGVPMYLFYGGGRPTRKLRVRLQRAKERVFRQVQETTAIPVTARTESISALITRYGGYPVYEDGEVKYYPCGEAMFSGMLTELEKAERYILVEYFIIAHGKMWNRILEILLKKAIQGVQVRIIYDGFGCLATLPRGYAKYLESLNEHIRCVTFNEVAPIFSAKINNRDHRKMLVIDGKVAFTGGINLADEYIQEKKRFGYWKDTGVKITGGAVRAFVLQFFYLFNVYKTEDVSGYLPPAMTGNKAEGLRIQPYDDSPLDNLPIAETVYLDIIDCAKDYVWIFTPYLVLDDKMRETLCKASMRGVDVRIVTPGIPDKKTAYRLTRSNYEVLLSAGVKIYEYSPGFIHAKSILADDTRAVVGTVNFDYRSFYHHFENAVYFSGCDAVLDLKRDCEETFAVSKQRTKENYKRSAIGKLFDGILRAFETLF